jgi:acetyl esterase/lipase
MNKALRIALLLFAGWSVYAARAANHPADYIPPEPSAVVPLWTGDPPGLLANARPETFVNERFGHVSIPQLLVYLPPKEKRSGTSLIICAGGGYEGLAMCLHVENVVRRLNDQGLAVFGLKYRTRYGTNDVVADALADLRRAVKLVRSRCAEWNLDPSRVGVQGYSAGANLCLNLISHFDVGDVQASDQVERFSSRPDFCALMATWPNGKTMDHFPLGPQTPPTWLATARDDTTAPLAFSEAIAERLNVLGVPHEVLVVESGGHGAFHYGLATGPGGAWPEPFLAWLNGILRAGDRGSGVKLGR